MNKIILLLIIISMPVFLLAGCRKELPDMPFFNGSPVPEVIDSPVDGGLSDTSDPNAKKSIDSDDLRSFSLRTEENWTVKVPAEKEGDPAVIYPAGMYRFEMKEEGGSVSVSADFAGDVYEFRADKDALKELDSLLKEYDVASMNGHSAYDSALGTLIDLEVHYGDGEHILIYAEGGASTIPYGWRDDFYIAFFDRLMKKCTGKSVAESLVEDNSDPDAVKEFASDQITEIYAEFTPDYDTSSMADEFEFGTYRFQYRDGGLPYQGIETNSALWLDNGVISDFDATPEDVRSFQNWIKTCGFPALNGWDKRSTTSTSMRLELHVYYDNGEMLSIEGDGEDAIPAAWDPIAFLIMIRDMAEKNK